MPEKRDVALFAVSEVELPVVRDGVIDGVPMKVVDARELWHCLRVQTPFNQWVGRRIAQHGGSTACAFHTTLCERRTRPTSRAGRLAYAEEGRLLGTVHNRAPVHCVFNAVMARHVAASENTPIGHLVREHLFRVEEELWRTNAEAAGRLQADLVRQWASCRRTPTRNARARRLRPWRPRS